MNQKNLISIVAFAVLGLIVGYAIFGKIAGEYVNLRNGVHLRRQRIPSRTAVRHWH